MCVFMRQTLNKSVQRALAGFAAGIMIAASIWGILIPHAHIPYQKVTDMHLWQLCHLAMVVPIADAYYESDDPEKVEKEWKMNIFRFLPSPFLAIMLAVTFGSSFGDKFMYQHAMKAPDEMRELHKQFYAYMKRMKKCGCKAKKVQ